MTMCWCWAGSLSLGVCSSIIYPLSRPPAGQILSNLPFFCSPSQQEVYCWAPLVEATAAAPLWSSTEWARLDVSFFNRILSSPLAALLSAGTSAMKQPHFNATFFDQWQATQSVRHRMPTNRSRLTATTPSGLNVFVAAQIQDVRGNSFLCCAWYPAQKPRK